MVKLVATLSSYGRRAVVVGGVADRYAGELARAGQSNRRRAGTGSASPERATRPPLWPAGMAEGNRETFGPRVGLSSHGSPAKGGPKSKCLARVKIARTSAGPPSLTISDLSRFPASRPAFPLPIRTCPAFPLPVPLSRFRPSRFPLPSRFPAFLDRFFQAFGHAGLKEAGATLEERIKKADGKGTSFVIAFSPGRSARQNPSLLARCHRPLRART